MSRRPPRSPRTDPRLPSTTLFRSARGIARRDGKVVFVEGALPAERVTAQTVRRKPSYEIARVENLLRPSVLRVTPRCPHFGVCGGRSEEHTSELQSLMRISYAVFCLKKQIQHEPHRTLCNEK